MVIKKERFERSLCKMIDVASLLLKRFLFLNLTALASDLKLIWVSSCSLFIIHKFNSYYNYLICILINIYRKG